MTQTIPQAVAEEKKTSVRIDEDIWARLRKRAIDERISTKDLLARIIAEYLDRVPPKED